MNATARRFVAYPCARCGETADGEMSGDVYFEPRLYCLNCADDFVERLFALEMNPGLRLPPFEDDAFRSTRP